MLMPIGRLKGRPVEEMTTPYLFWLVCNDAIRFTSWPLIVEILDVLRKRFERFDDLLVELHLDHAPPDRWNIRKERKAERALKRSEKLAALLVERAKEERQERIALLKSELERRAAQPVTAGTQGSVTQSGTQGPRSPRRRNEGKR